ncbi:unnamed protein product [Bemisia tabaci]|uniref:Orcokinin n=1 Tax=Bemisia tabaci TaxID=7038 RepID=A0A9P0A0U5_BEMTA|nr:unnamed protein product [Bemisia tabaci]
MVPGSFVCQREVSRKLCLVSSGSTLGEQKRNFDEIDRSGFNKFTHKRNFDEIDRSGFDSFVKRQRNFDEIDRAGFVGFNKRSVPDAAYQKPPSKAAN